MADFRNLSELTQNRVSPKTLLADMTGNSQTASREAGLHLIAEAKSFGLDLKDYLRLKVDPKMAEGVEAARYAGLNGYEASLSFLNLPIRTDIDNGVTLQAAAETFQTFPGTRALFPQVIDDVVRWAYHQDNIEQIAPLLAGSRTINGVELLSTVVNDSELTDQIATEIAEGARIPVKSIRTSEHSVRFYKHGLAYRTTYEFNRRVAIDILTPYANRALRELERSKLKRAVGLLVNGDSVYSAAPVVNQSTYNANSDANATNGKLAYQNMLQWLVAQAKAGTPVDTVVGNWDSYFQWIKMFSVPTSVVGPTQSEIVSKTGFQFEPAQFVGGPIKFQVASDAPANKLIGFSKGDTLEELVEAGSLISQSEQSMANQTITYYRTENTGYRLVFGDTRSVYNYNA